MPSTVNHQTIIDTSDTQQPSLPISDRDITEKCGVFGVLIPPKASQLWENMGQYLYYGLYALQHRGQESCGMAVFDDDQLHIHKGMGLVNQVFEQSLLAKLTGQIGIGHTRYSTTGDSSLDNAQPIVARTRNGALTLAHNGNLINTDALKQRLANWIRPRSGCTDTTLVAEDIRHRLQELEGHDIDWALPNLLKEAFQSYEGAFSFIMAFGNRLIAARDAHGIRPLCYGITPEGMVVFASESCALDIIGAQFVRDIEPGEMAIVDLNGNITFSSFSKTDTANSPLNNKKDEIQALSTQNEPTLNTRGEHLCFFELVYFARPDSRLGGKLVYEYRLDLGKTLAERARTKYGDVEADMVIPVPDSGNVAAVGYSQQSGIPYMEGLIKNRYVGRTFIHPTPALRERSIQLKLNPLTDILKGKRIIVVDDSIVRGNTSKKLVAMLKECGVKEIHLRISSAPVKHPCFYGIDMSTPDQLIANLKSTEEMREWLGVDSLVYLSETDMKSVGQRTRLEENQPTEDYTEDYTEHCMACFNGHYPAGQEGLVTPQLQPLKCTL